MKNNVVVSFLAALLLSGCASVNDLRSQVPYASFHTSAATKVVAMCIRDAWQNQKIGGAPGGGDMQETGSGYAIAAPSFANPIELVDIHNDGQIQMFVSSGTFKWRKDLRASAIKGCL
jgi:uncharacterized protein YceK